MAKRYEELTLADDFMFCKMLSANPGPCRVLTMRRGIMSWA